MNTKLLPNNVMSRKRLIDSWGTEGTERHRYL